MFDDVEKEIRMGRGGKVMELADLSKLEAEIKTAIRKTNTRFDVEAPVDRTGKRSSLIGSTIGENWEEVELYNELEQYEFDKDLQTERWGAMKVGDVITVEIYPDSY